MLDDSLDEGGLPGAAEAAIGEPVQVCGALNVGPIGVEHHAPGLSLRHRVGGDQVGSRSALGIEADRAHYPEIGHPVGHQRAGRRIAIGQDRHIKAGLGIIALGLGHEESDMVGIGRPVERNADRRVLGKSGRGGEAGGHRHGDDLAAGEHAYGSCCWLRRVWRISASIWLASADARSRRERGIGTTNSRMTRAGRAVRA
ncbi:hypothetical protein D3C72_1640360 [compost metagenome]